MVILLILIFGTVTGYDLQCPAKSEWHWRANVSCISEDKYVCLFHLLENKYKENCLGSDLSSIGNKLVFQPLFNLAECNSERYQPVVFTTYGNSECILIKSKCDEEGQVVYSNASTKSDIACRCDYTKGYTFVSKPQHSCFCLPSEEDCSCFRAKCSNLSSDYQCITDAIIKPKTACQEIQQQISLNKDNTIVLSIDSNTHSDMRPSNMELIVYTLCVIGFLIIIELSHFIRSYRKRSSINIPRENVRERVELRQEIVEPEYIEIYDEIDEHLIGESNSDTAVTQPLRNLNATVSKAQTDKTSNSYVDDTSSYLEPCFTAEETDNKSSSKESSSNYSSNLDLIIPDHTGYLNPYQPLRERQLISDGYEVTVPVHKNSDSSTGSESSEEMSSSYKYFHVYHQLQIDQSTQNHEHEKATKTSNEMNINLSKTNEIQDCRNKVSKDIESIDLLNRKEADEIDNEKGQLNAHLFFGQTIGDACRGVSEKSLNEDNDDTDYTDKSLNTDTSQRLYVGESNEHNAHIQRVDILTDYLDMNNPVNTCTGDIF